MRVEGEHRVGAANHLSMPEMNPVERPDGDPPGPATRLDIWK
jgi:hypothetical protein